jgi:hypothetical protein
MIKSSQAFKYRGSKNDRAVIKRVLISVGFLGSVIGLFALLFLYDGYWSPAVRRDSQRLDSVLLAGRIDTVEIFWPFADTNILRGQDASNYLALLTKSHRVRNIDWTKQQTQTVRLLSGTNNIAVLSLGEDGAYEFGAYGFRTR